MASNKEFSAILEIISARIVDKIINEYNLKDYDAINSLYNSKLYALLEKEETKLWHYSVEMLFDLYQEEKSSGTLTMPQ